MGMTVGTQARWLVRTAVSSAGRNLEETRGGWSASNYIFFIIYDG